MKMQRKRTVLTIDDDEVNLMILTKTVEDAGYATRPFLSGEAAWEYLQQHRGEADIVLLDKMMPGMSGIELLRHIKSSDRFRHIPVIIQTGDVGLTQMREGLESGAHYYLTKPFHPEILTALLHSAENECAMREELLTQMTENHARFVHMLQEGQFVLRTLSEARFFAASLSQAALYPEFVALGLMELLSNAIEHGNLDMGYERKRKSLMAGTWEQDLTDRAESAEYRNRNVHIHMEKTLQGLHITITDEGKGFNWQRHMYDEDAAGRLNEPNGRGIAKAMIMLDDVRYVGRGNEVHCNIGVPTYLGAGETAAPAKRSS